MNDAASTPAVPWKDTATRILMGSAGGGIGVAMVFVLLEVHRSDPKLLGELLRAWGPLSVLLGMVLFFGYRQNERGIRVQQDVVNAQRATKESLDVSLTAFATAAQGQNVSMRDMSEALNRVANKDNETLLRLEARIDETSDRTKRIVAWIEREEERLKIHAPNR